MGDRYKNFDDPMGDKKKPKYKSGHLLRVMLGYG